MSEACPRVSRVLESADYSRNARSRQRSRAALPPVLRVSVDDSLREPAKNRRQSRSAPSLLAFALCGMALCLASTAHGAWVNAAWHYRRPINVTWDAVHGSGQQLCSFDFYTDGHALAGASDVFVATEAGQFLPTRLLQVGPGDRVRVLFALKKNVRNYDVYFGNSKAATATVAPGRNVPITGGLLMSMRGWDNGNARSFRNIEHAYDNGQPAIGQVMIPQLFLGYNPLGSQTRRVSKITGSLFAPETGSYLFAMSVDRFGALLIDGKPILKARRGPGDIRYHASIALDRGRHDLTFYHAANSEWGRFTVGWQTPSSSKVKVIGRESFGTCYGAQVGTLQQQDHTLNADFDSTYVGLVPIGVDNAYMVHFHCPAKGVSLTKYTWDFGDGQHADTADVDHVYLRQSVMPVKLSIDISGNSETETRRLVVGPDYQHPLHPPMVSDQTAAKIVAGFDPQTLSPDSLAEAARLLVQADSLDRAEVFATRLASLNRQKDARGATEAMSAVSDALVAGGNVAAARALWAGVPNHSNLQPHAIKTAGALATWTQGDFSGAMAMLQPYAHHGDVAVRRLYAQALLLDGKSTQAQSLLAKLPDRGNADQHAVQSGAFARSIDYYIRRNEPDAGEEAWDRWQAKYPGAFLDGYAAVLRAQLIALRGHTAVAAKVAAAYAIAMPHSAYAPRLLDMASHWLAHSDPAQSRALRERLKKDYPEDPLAQ